MPNVIKCARKRAAGHRIVGGADLTSPRYMMTERSYLLFAMSLALAGILLGCNPYNEVLKSPDLEYKYTRAVGFVDSNACYGALPILEELAGLTRGTERGRDVQFQLGRAHFCVGDYYLARYHLRQFSRTFPSDARAEEAQFQAAICSYRLSPSAALDQSETKAAMEEFQLFLDRFPSSAYRDSSQKMVDDLLAKLQRKSFDNAALYHRTQQYHSATIALRNALKEHPDTPYREEIQWLILDSHFQYARQSTERRKLERYNEALDAFLTFAARFPQSLRLPDAQRIQKSCLAEMERLTATPPPSTP